MSVPAQTHPRRRGVKATSPQMTPIDTQNVPSFQKAGTFHSPSSGASDLCNPIVNYAFMPKRSSTSPEDLEELLNGAGVRRVTNILEQFDRTFAGESSASPDASILNDREVLPVPNFMLDNTSIDRDAMDVDKPVQVEHHHASDSGLGSSINESCHDGSLFTRHSAATGVSLTRSFTAVNSRRDTGHSLGRNAIRHIEEKIIKPILAEKSLKDFHPLVADVPHRIGTKDINNLRDLEKTLLFLAPDYSTSPELFYEFCERSIQCIHTTVEYLCERDQRLPTDKPYSNNYFLDLIEQIRRYAQIMAATRRKQEKGESLDEMDYKPEEKLALRGGLSENGRPLEIVRERDGKVIPIPDADMSDPKVTNAFNSTKRSFDEEEEEDLDDGALRSMARRRKSEKPGDVVHSCDACGKQFKRPCDLTKHKKTHTRPFKCPVEKCKYHTEGWPTEKERDRHFTDKHDPNPKTYHCEYPGCTYGSKRESNCKQHMEKSHGYVYNRTKSNGRKKKLSSSGQTPITPTTPFDATPASNLLPTPNTPSLASPMFPMGDNFNFGFAGQQQTAFSDFNAYRRDSASTMGTAPSYGSGISPDQDIITEFSPEPCLLGAFEGSTFEDAISPEEANVNHAVFFDNNMAYAGGNMTVAGPQQHTPALSAQYDPFVAPQAPTLSVNMPAAVGVPHLSPNAQPDVTLAPNMNNNLEFDETFSETFNDFAPPQADFTLFGNENAMNYGSGQHDFFGDINNMGAHLETQYEQPNFTLDDLMQG